ncbi:MAG: tRNA (adenosine(37)-N6)-threonylcarbamoyltransferase complex ATPase subunit type 1 TsaE [Ruminococcus sp.]|nr:tRNA (adenosine(37)-N6)-threonylcarbamoyltransferase complex ATPase subunit type 1 TsaE [Ruminococcus sp.]
MSVFSRVFVTRSPEETVRLGAKIGSLLNGGELLAYRGGLGGGKTTFTRGLAVGMGLPDEVSSPTFAIVNEYRADGHIPLFHFDMYRIEGGAALEATGFFDYLSENAVVAAEWSENIADDITALSRSGTEVITVEFEYAGEDNRKITLTAPGGKKFADAWD